MIMCTTVHSKQFEYIIFRLGWQLDHIFIFVTKAVGEQKLKPKMLHLWMVQEAFNFNLIDFSNTFSEVVFDLHC